MIARRLRGFTFIEILFVIAIMAMLLAMAVPKMRGMFSRGEIEVGAREVAALLRTARHAAIVRGDGAELRIDPEGGRYQVVLTHLEEEGIPLAEAKRRHGHRRKTDAPEFRLSDDASGTRTLPDKVFFTLVHSSAPPTEDHELPRIIFYPDGSATPGVIGIQNEAGKALKIEIYRTTGMAMVGVGKPVVPRGTRPLFVRADKVPIYESSEDASDEANP